MPQDSDNIDLNMVLFTYPTIYVYMEHDGVVGIATSYGLDGSGLGFR